MPNKEIKDFPPITTIGNDALFLIQTDPAVTRVVSEISFSGLISNIQSTLLKPQLLIGAGNPEGIVVAASGSIYTDYLNKQPYMKISGGSVGWV